MVSDDGLCGVVVEKYDIKVVSFEDDLFIVSVSFDVYYVECFVFGWSFVYCFCDCFEVFGVVLCNCDFVMLFVGLVWSRWCCWFV